jgi:hypothetical protein
VTVQDTPPVVCEHRARPWANAPIGRQLLTQLVDAGQLEPTPCDACPPTEMETI